MRSGSMTRCPPGCRPAVTRPGPGRHRTRCPTRGPSATSPQPRAGNTSITSSGLRPTRRTRPPSAAAGRSAAVTGCTPTCTSTRPARPPRSCCNGPTGPGTGAGPTGGTMSCPAGPRTACPARWWPWDRCRRPASGSGWRSPPRSSTWNSTQSPAWPSPCSAARPGGTCPARPAAPAWPRPTGTRPRPTRRCSPRPAPRGRNSGWPGARHPRPGRRWPPGSASR